MIHALLIVAHPVTHDLMTVERIVLPFFGRSSLGTSEHGVVEFFGEFEGVDREGVVERRSWRGGGEGDVFSSADVG